MEDDGIDMEDDLKMTVSIWEMTVSIWEMTVSMWDILSLWADVSPVPSMSVFYIMVVSQTMTDRFISPKSLPRVIG